MIHKTTADVFGIITILDGDRLETTLVPVSPSNEATWDDKEHAEGKSIIRASTENGFAQLQIGDRGPAEDSFEVRALLQVNIHCLEFQ